jgi:hypothetical protein
MEDSSTLREAAHEAQELETVNGLSVNGLSVNGLSVNGLSVNGLSVNGLSVNGLSVNGLASEDFQSWFQSNPTQNSTLMSYVVRCAAPAGQTLTYTDDATDETYSWSGGLGLAPDWAGGEPATLVEQQLVSACLAAHANKFGVHVSISVLGLDGTDQAISSTSAELTTYAQKEACIFGNLFNNEGVYVGNDGGQLSASQSSARVCTLANVPGTSYTDCTPLERVSPCSTLCTLDASQTYYTSCTYQGVTYRPLTTRLRAQDISVCGDGICQFTESCGTSNQADNCLLDCGACN